MRGYKLEVDRLTTLFAAILLVGWLAGCTAVNVEAPVPRGSAFITAPPPKRESIAAMIAATPMNGENIVRRRIADGPASTMFLVRIDDREEPHRHSRYDMTVTLVEGVGTMWIDGAKQRMARGDVAHVPRGVPHYFVNQSSSPAAALVVFSPAFSGPDSEPVAP